VLHVPGYQLLVDPLKELPAVDRHHKMHLELSVCAACQLTVGVLVSESGVFSPAGIPFKSAYFGPLCKTLYIEIGQC
jgi:hypothetical protein